MATGGENEYDVLIVGGGPAGLSAALVLGRMRRRVLVCDTDSPANAVSHGVGGLLSRDGTPPAELRRIAREQLADYPSVEVRTAEVSAAHRVDERFEVHLEGAPVRARKVLLAHGLDYGLPEISGLDDLWGELAFHCPFCHGWEVRDKRIAVLATSPKAGHQALLLASVSDTVSVVGDADLEDPDRPTLERGGIEQVAAPVERLERDGSGVRIELAGREPLTVDAVFIQTTTSLRSDLAEQLGAELTETGLVSADPDGATSVSGLHVAGDATGGTPQSVAIAIGSGARAGSMIQFALAAEDAGEPT